MKPIKPFSPSVKNSTSQPRFKMSEVKNIPSLRFPHFLDDWKKYSLIDTVDKNEKWAFTGGPFGSDLKSSDYTQSGIRVIQLQNIGDGEFIDKYQIFTSERKANDLLGCNIYPGDILISKMGDPVGRCCIVPNIQNRFLMCSDGIRLVVNKLDYNKNFIYQSINNKIFRNSVESKSTGSTRKRIGLSDLKEIKLNIPSLPEQKKIAEFLTSVDKRIELLKKKKNLLETYKKGVMKKIFNQEIRFKDDNGNFFPDWKDSTIGKSFQIVGGGTPSTTNIEFWDGDINWFTPTEIKKRTVSSSLRKITREGLQNSSAKILPINTLLFTSRATIGEMSFATEECTTNQGFQSILPSGKNDNRYFYYWASQNRKIFLRKSTGSTFLEISKKTLENIQISIPSLLEQNKIVEFLSSIDKQIELLDFQIDNSKTWKKGLLQKMFV